MLHWGFPRYFYLHLWSAQRDPLLFQKKMHIGHHEGAPKRQDWVLLLAACSRACSRKQGTQSPAWILACYCTACSILLFSQLLSALPEHSFPNHSFFQCASIHKPLISFSRSGSFLLYTNRGLAAISSCSETLSFPELPAKSVDLAALNLTELVNGMLSTALRGNASEAGQVTQAVSPMVNEIKGWWC